MFAANQIVCLDSHNQSLYCEFIDAITNREMCWIRPVILVDLPQDDGNNSQGKEAIYDVRYTADIFCNDSKVRAALDTEYLDFFVHLKEPNWNEDRLNFAKKQVQDFISQKFKESYQTANVVKTSCKINSNYFSTAY